MPTRTHSDGHMHNQDLELYRGIMTRAVTGVWGGVPNRVRGRVAGEGQGQSPGVEYILKFQ